METEVVVFAVVEAAAVDVAEDVTEIERELLDSPVSCRRSMKALGDGGGSRRS